MRVVPVYASCSMPGPWRNSGNIGPFMSSFGGEMLLYFREQGTGLALVPAALSLLSVSL